MSENDIIAEYVKKNRPEILNSMSFVFFKIGRMCRNVAEQCVEALKKFNSDLEHVARAADGLEVGSPIIDEIHPEEAYCKPEKRFIDADAWIDKLWNITQDQDAPGEYVDYCLHLISEIDSEFAAQKQAQEKEGEE